MKTSKKECRGAQPRHSSGIGKTSSINATASKPNPRLEEAVSLLPCIPADDYAVWFEVGCALKKLGASYEAFREWSATSDKFDEGECERKWEGLPDDPRCGISTIRRYAGVEVGEYHSTFVPPPETMLPAPTSDDERVRQVAEFICKLFKPGEFLELCGSRMLKGRLIPDREDDVTLLSEGTTVDDLCQDSDFRKFILTPDTGLYIGLNPLQCLEGTGHKAPTDAMVTDYRLALLEADDMSLGEQWGAIRKMRLPIAAITFSGSKSLHVLVRVDADDNLQLYKERVATLHELANACGFKTDPSCRNPSRLTRLPGAKRGENTQRMVSWAWGYPDWYTFAAAELTPPSDTASVVEAEPVDPEPLLVNYNDQGKIISLSQYGFAQYAVRELNLIHAEGDYWRYNSETGLWNRLDPEDLNKLLFEVAHRCRERFDLDLVRFMNANTCRDVREFMAPTKPNPFEHRPKGVTHVANGMLEIGEDGDVTLRPFSPEYYSRYRCEIAYDSDAQCPRFLSELLGAALPPEDIELLQRYAGQCLLGVNMTQTFLLLTGTAGGGKGTIVNVIREVIGGDKVVELRTSQLEKRFEYAQFIGKTLLTGSDVRSDFLLQRGASHIKSLCGGDPLTAEIKCVTGGVNLKGDFNIIITANDRPLLNIDGDTNAWRRRVLWIPFERPRTANPIPNFDQLLFNEEGPGILNWMIEGAVKVLRDGIPGHTLAAQRLDLLLRESDSIYGFLSECVEIDPDCGERDGLTCYALQRAYERWCDGNGYTKLPEREAGRKMKETIGHLFRIGQSHDLLENGLSARGYRNLRPRRADCPAQTAQQVQTAQTAKPVEEHLPPVVELRPVPRVHEATPTQSEEDNEADTPALPVPPREPAPPRVPVQRDGLEEDDLGIVQPEFGF